MIRYVEGDLVKMAKEGKFDVIAHGCNCFCAMGAGIAPQIKNAFPEAFEADCETVAGDESKMGTISHTVYSKPTIVNIYSQYDTKGRRSGNMDLDYDALRSGLKEMKAKFSGKTFGLPMIGAGLAGGDWDIIEKIIEDEMIGEYVTIVQYVP
jgi:O-acetyl-ADP-ribose deacetylase (regulator of RNase III)